MKKSLHTKIRAVKLTPSAPRTDEPADVRAARKEGPCWERPFMRQVAPLQEEAQKMIINDLDPRNAGATMQKRAIEIKKRS